MVSINRLPPDDDDEPVFSARDMEAVVAHAGELFSENMKEGQQVLLDSVRRSMYNACASTLDAFALSLSNASIEATPRDVQFGAELMNEKIVLLAREEAAKLRANAGGVGK